MAVTDNFTGTDDTTLPVYSGNWVNPKSASYWDCYLKTNAATAHVGGGIAFSIYTGVAFANDQYSQATVVNLASSAQYLTVRTAVNTINTGYGGGASFSTNALYRIIRFSDGTTLAAHGSQAMTIGDVVQLSVTGSILTLIVNGSTILTTSADTTFTSGSPGMQLTDTASPTQPLFDNWGGDDVGVTPVPPVPVRRMVSLIYS